MPTLEAAGITKRFGGILALKDMHFTAQAGEVHAILGENGAGKSTFIQILSGALTPDEGTIKLNGNPLRLRGPMSARRAGIVPVFQELSLIPDLTVAENIYFGSDTASRFATISQSRLGANATALFDELGLPPIAGDVPIRALSIAEQQLVEIVKALARDPEVLILDEATSALFPDKVDWLIALARKRAAAGKVVLYISHRMDEVRRVADRVTVLRNGETVGTEATANLTDDAIVSLMLGHRLDSLFPARRPTSRPEPALSVKNLSSGRHLHDVSFTLYQGEILALAGLQGHGQRELMMALYGAARSRGQISLRGKPVTIRSPRAALSNSIGVALLPEDRRSQGLFLSKSIRENIALAALRQITRNGIVKPSAERQLAEGSMAKLQIKAASIEQLAGTLSGGNQQKVVLAKLLATEARILLFFDPTRGVDVGTKAEIFALMRDLAEQGMAILFYSTDVTELAHVADRILVLTYGRIAAELSGNDMTEANILRATLSPGEAA